MKIQTTAYDTARRFLGLSEVPGSVHNPLILAMLQLDQQWPSGDEVPWCSAFVNFVAHVLGLSRSKDLRARSWLAVGRPVELLEARPENDVVVLQRGAGRQPGPQTLNAPGHVGFFANRDGGFVSVLGGNQSDGVSIARFPVEKVLGVRRLAG